MKQAHISRREQLTTAALLLGEAIRELLPAAQLIDTGATDTGFYCDAVIEQPVEDFLFSLLEQRMHTLIREEVVIESSEMLPRNGADFFASQHMPFAVERAQQWKGQLLPIARIKRRAFICSEPPLDSASQLGVVKLIEVSRVFMEETEVVRIRGILAPTKSDLKALVKRLERAKEFDHRKLGSAMGLFQSVPDVGDGLWNWLPKGEWLRSKILQTWEDTVRKSGFQRVRTPSVASSYFLQEVGDDDHDVATQDLKIARHHASLHARLFGYAVRHYSELPVKFAEVNHRISPCSTGDLLGLLSAREYFTDLNSIFCRQDQLESVLLSGLHSIQHFLTIFGVKGIVSLRSRPASRRNPHWEQATQRLRRAAQDAQIAIDEVESSAPLAGPVLEWTLEDASGNRWVGSHLGIDLAHPEAQKLRYFGADELNHPPFMVGMVLLGSVERLVALLLEQHEGVLPLWLSPEAVRILPTSTEEWGMADSLAMDLTTHGITVTVDRSHESLGARVAEGLLSRVPYLAILGHRERRQQAVSVRTANGKETLCPIPTFVARMSEEVKKTS